MVGLFDLERKVAWITGASYGGLGFYHALTLAKQGAHVVISDLLSRAEDLAQAEGRLKDQGAKAFALYADVSKEEDVREAVTSIEKEFGIVDIIVNNAAVSIDIPALEMRLEDWNRVISVTLTGAWLCSRTACKLMVRKRVKGKIVNIASVYSCQADFDPSAPYYAAKAGITNLTRALALEWASHGINVNAIAPGYFFPTGMTRSLNEETKQRYINRIPLRRAGDPTKDLAGALIFLSSSASDYVTGQTIFVDGGWTAT
jgi:gluconate 5-dehydrogenase